MKAISILLMGCGGVGRQLLHHIVNCRYLHLNQGVRIRVMGVCDSRALVAVNDPFLTELTDESLLELCRAKSSGSPLSSLSFDNCHIFEDSEVMEKVVDIAGHLGRTPGLAVVDCSASLETVQILKQVIDLGCSVVLANKKPLTSDIGDYAKLTSHFRRIRFESTVGAGLPVIASLARMISSGDPIYRIVGSLSGTLGYVMSELEAGKLVSEVVRAAKDLGYTEPDPRDDLGGMDVARKALILARVLGQQIEMADILVESLYPVALGPSSLTIEEFLKNGLPKIDNEVEERIKGAASRGKVLRYVCVIEGSRCQVGLRELPKDSALGRLRGSDNVVEVYSRCYKESPLVIQGAGAGNDTTAAGVLADIVDLQDLF